jgi:hypothetical protein
MQHYTSSQKCAPINIATAVRKWTTRTAKTRRPRKGTDAQSKRVQHSGSNRAQSGETEYSSDSLPSALAQGYPSSQIVFSARPETVAEKFSLQQTELRSIVRKMDSPRETLFTNVFCLFVLFSFLLCYGLLEKARNCVTWRATCSCRLVLLRLSEQSQRHNSNQHSSSNTTQMW